MGGEPLQLASRYRARQDGSEEGLLAHDAHQEDGAHGCAVNDTGAHACDACDGDGCRRCETLGGPPGPKPPSIPASFWVATAVEAIVTLSLCWLFQYAFHNPMCGFVFRCGCTFPWLGGWKNCNVHNPNSPHCPWCIAVEPTVWATSDAFVISLMFAGWLLARLATIKRIRTLRARASSKRFRFGDLRRYAWLRAIMPPVMFTVHAVICGLAFALATGYPYFLWWTFKDTQRRGPPLPPVHNATPHTTHSLGHAAHHRADV